MASAPFSDNGFRSGWWSSDRRSDGRDAVGVHLERK